MVGLESLTAVSMAFKVIFPWIKTMVLSCMSAAPW